MEPRPAGCDPDLRRVVTPLDVNKTRALLCKYGLLPDWDHILQGIANGFNVGIKSPPSCTLIFRESRILTARPGFYYGLHCWGSSIWSLFTGFSSQRAGAAHWSFSYVSSWPGTQTELRQVQDDSRFVLPAQRPQILFSKQFHQFRRLSNYVGNIRQHGRFDIVFTGWLCSCYVRHLSCLPYNSGRSESTELAVCILGWHGVCRQSRDVWADLQRWSLWFSGRHASGYISSGRFRSSQKVGGRLLCDQAPTRLLDRAGVHCSHSRYWGSLESGEAETVFFGPTLHWIRLGPGLQVGWSPSGQAVGGASAPIIVAIRIKSFHSEGSGESSWQIGPHFLHFSINSAFPPFYLILCIILYFIQSSEISPTQCQS
jgi:hypothetical protein